MLKKSSLFIFLGVSIFVIGLKHFNIAGTLELKTQDLRFVMRGARPVSDDIFIVAVGDESISPAALGRWPWRRAYLASFLSWMADYSLGEIIFDILFTEPSVDFPIDDDFLAGQAARLDNVYFPFFCIPEDASASRGYSEDMDEVNKDLLERISFGNASDFKDADFIKIRDIVMPIPLLSKQARGSGFVNAIPDRDGITRRLPLLMEYEDHLIPNVAFYVALRHLGIDKEDVEIRPGRSIILNTPDRVIKIPIDRKCQMLVNHAGEFNPENIPMASFISIIGSHDSIVSGEEPVVKLKELEGKIMFLGLTATGTSDLRPTPFSPIFPMVGFLSTVTSNIITEDFIVPVRWWVNYILILFISFIAAFIAIKFRAIPSALLNLLLMALYFFASFLVFRYNYMITTFYPVFAVVLSYAGVTIYRFTGEEKEKRVIKNVFQRYVSSQVVDVLLKHPETISLGGEKKYLTVFFSDIRGFTSMSEKLEPEEVVKILNEYLTEMIDVIFKYNGTLDKFMGDAIMAIWGAPVKQPNHAKLAVKAAIEMKKRLKVLQEKWKIQGRETIAVGMGINTGDVVVGNMGSDQFADYTVIGDNVNLAARLEENAAAGQLIISESTYREVKDEVSVNRLAPLKVKGKEKVVEVYEVVGLK